MSDVRQVDGSGITLFRLFRILQLENIDLKCLFVLTHLIKDNGTWFIEFGVYKL